MKTTPILFAVSILWVALPSCAQNKVKMTASVGRAFSSVPVQVTRATAPLTGQISRQVTAATRANVAAGVTRLPSAAFSSPLPKNMASRSSYDSEGRYATGIPSSSAQDVRGTLGAWTAHREFNGPSFSLVERIRAQEAAKRAAEAAKKVKEQAQAALEQTTSAPQNPEPVLSDVAYFHRWTQEGTVAPQGEYVVPLEGDPYASGQRKALQLEQRVNNGEAKPTEQMDSFERQLQREQDAPTVYLEGEELAEFNTTVAVGRELAAKPQEFPRRKTDARRVEVVSGGTWDPFRAPTPLELMAPPKNPLAEAQQYEIFDEKNYLDYGEFTLPFHPQVRELNVLVASDEAGFIDHLRSEPDPRVHLTAVSSGNEAIGELRAHPDKYHVILTDMHMRNGTGMDVAKYVQTHDLPAYVTVISKASGNPGTLFLLGFDGSMAVMRSPDSIKAFRSQFEQENPGVVFDVAGIERFRSWVSDKPIYQPAGKVFSYLSNLVANGGHIYPQL